MTINIILYSFLRRSEGGRETWLYNLLNNSTFTEKVSHINVYHLKDEGDEDTVYHLIKKGNISFKGVKSSTSVPHLLRFPLYFISVFIKLIFRPVKKDELFIAVGSFWETMLLYALKLFRRRATGIVWIRSFFHNEISNKLPSFLVKAFFKFELHMLRKSDLRIANGKDTRAIYLEYGIDSVVIENAVDLSHFRTNQNCLTRPVVKIAYIGRFKDEKGIRSYINAIKTANKEREPASSLEFFFVGYGKYEEEIEALAREYGNVSFCGKLSNEKVLDFLSGIDCTVNLSRYSGQGCTGVSHSLLESLASGNLLICWNTPTFSQVISGDNGCLVEENDDQALGELFIDISRNREVYRKKAEESLLLAKRYGFETHINKFFKTIDELLT